MNRKGFMLVLSSPSGGGKTTIAKTLFKKDSNLVASVSVTTREPRLGEMSGVDYYFVSEQKFLQMIKNGDFLEYAKVFGGNYYYGTTLRSVESYLDKGIDVVFDIDWQGHSQLLQHRREDVVSVFILPPSMEELKRRLYERGDSAENIEYRMNKASNEISKWELYDYVFINHNIQDSVETVVNIVKSERSKRIRQMHLDDFVDTMINRNV